MPDGHNQRTGHASIRVVRHKSARAPRSHTLMHAVTVQRTRSRFDEHGRTPVCVVAHRRTQPRFSTHGHATTNTVTLQYRPRRNTHAVTHQRTWSRFSAHVVTLQRTSSRASARAVMSALRCVRSRVGARGSRKTIRLPRVCSRGGS